MSGGNRHWEQDKDSTLYIGNLDEQVTDALVWELMIQAGPVVNVHLPKDRVSQNHQGYGFVEFATERDADYAAALLNQVRMFGKPIRLNKATADKRTADGSSGAVTGVGAELFVGNLDSLVDERTLYETFSRFGPLLAPPKITRDENNLSKGYGFISYASFASSDDAVTNMHGQYLMNKEVTVQYAYKKDGKGERHGDAAERALAAQAIKNGVELQIPAMPAALVMQPQVVQAMPNGYPMGGPVGPPQGMPYSYAPSPVQAGFQHPPRQYNQSPLQAPGASAGLPARPPQSNAGYGGPMMAPGMAPPGMPGMPPGYLPPGAPPGNYPGR